MDSSWCQEGLHYQYDFLADFNNWLEGDDELAEAKREELQIDQFMSPSKALFAGDKNQYFSVLAEYRQQFQQKALSLEWLNEICGDTHWYTKNQRRLDQLLNLIEDEDIIPFVGAGLSVAGGFPTWKSHLKEQGRTAGLDGDEVDQLIDNGQFEQVIHLIEQQDFLEAFEQELEDSFSHVDYIPETTRLIAELFTDTVITTNYDKLIEYTLENDFNKPVQLIDNRNPNEPRDNEAVSVIKLHGDIRTPQHCIMSQNHYNNAYGEGAIDLTLAIPTFLRQTFISSSLLFLGCSLNNDRTVEVFKQIKQQARADGDILPKHYSIEQAPDTEDGISARNQELLSMGITPIWFQPGEFDTVTEILKFASHEVKYRLAMTVND